MRVLVIINNVGIEINADVSVKNWLTKGCVVKTLFEILVILIVMWSIILYWRIFRL